MDNPMYNRAGLNWLVDVQHSSGARWARDEIERLERELAEARTMINEAKDLLNEGTGILLKTQDELGRVMAQAAAMREALEFYASLSTHEWIWDLLAQQTCSDLCDKTFEFQGCLSGKCAKDIGERSWIEAHDKATAALSTNAGRKVLDVVEAARELAELRGDATEGDRTKLRQALTAL